MIPVSSETALGTEIQGAIAAPRKFLGAPERIGAVTDMSLIFVVIVGIQLWDLTPMAFFLVGPLHAVLVLWAIREPHADWLVLADGRRPRFRATRDARFPGAQRILYGGG